VGTETLLKFSCIETVTEREAAGVCLQGNCEKMVLRFSSGATSVTRSSRSHIRIRVSEFYTHRYVYIDTYTYIHTRVVDRCVGGGVLGFVQNIYLRFIVSTNVDYTMGMRYVKP